MNTSSRGALHQFSRSLRGFWRLAANHCLLPSLRHSMLKWSGLTIGKNAFVNMGVTVIDDYEPGGLTIGERVAVAPNVTFVIQSYPNNSCLRDRASLNASGPIKVGNDVWLGTGAVIMPNVSIGNCAIVGACSLVTKDVEEFAIVAGVPARKIGDVRDRK